MTGRPPATARASRPDAKSKARNLKSELSLRLGITVQQRRPRSRTSRRLRASVTVTGKLRPVSLRELEWTPSQSQAVQVSQARAEKLSGWLRRAAALPRHCSGRRRARESESHAGASPLLVQPAVAGQERFTSD